MVGEKRWVGAERVPVGCGWCREDLLRDRIVARRDRMRLVWYRVGVEREAEADERYRVGGAQGREGVRWERVVGVWDPIEGDQGRVALDGVLAARMWVAAGRAREEDGLE